MPQRSKASIIALFMILISYIALITILPSVQFMPKSIIWFQDRQRLLELLLICFIFLEAISSMFNRVTLLPINKWMRSAFFMLFILSSISAFCAHSPRHAFVEISTFVGLSYLALFAAKMYIENQPVVIKFMSYTIWASILLYLTSFYTGYITATIFKTPLHWPFPFTGFSNIRSFNQYQLWPLAFITLPLLAFNLKKNTQIYIYFALTCWWILLFYSASRGVLVAWLVGVIFTAAIYQKNAWPMVKIQFINIATGFSGYYFLFKFIPSLRESTLITHSVIRETTDDRLALWNQAFVLIKQFPLFGVGPMHYAWYNKTNGHPHNSLLQLASEWGLLATFIVLAIVSYAVYSWLKKFNCNALEKQSILDKNISVLLFFTFVTNATYSLVDGVIVTPISQVLMFSMLGLMIGHYNFHCQPAIKEASTSNGFRFRPFFAAIILVVMTWSSLPEVIQGLLGNEKGFSMGYTAAGPRFWHEVK
jgi:putative inorganic carbon (hco3(-)) transporter